MPRRERSLAGVVRAAEEVLRRQRLPHVFVGGIAVIVFGEPRTTRDVDVLAKIPPKAIPALTTDFRGRGFFASEFDLEAAVREGGHSSIEDRKSALRIDLVPVTRRSHERALRGAVRIRWRGIQFPVASPEDTIVMKLSFGSEQDIEDAHGILAEQWERLDFEKLRSVAREERVLTILLDSVERAGEALGEPSPLVGKG